MKGVLKRSAKMLVDLTSLYNVFKVDNNNNLSKKTDRESLADDWNKVGGDIKWSMNQMESKIKVMK